jgi:hypothetical protein
VECKRDIWSIVLPVIGTLLGATVAMVGSIVATRWTLNDEKAARQDERLENRSAEQRTQQGGVYLEFLSVANTGNDAIVEYELCTGECESEAAAGDEGADAADEALGLVHVYGSYDAYTTALDIRTQLFERIAMRRSDTPDYEGSNRYDDMRFDFLRYACNDVNAIRISC